MDKLEKKTIKYRNFYHTHSNVKKWHSDDNLKLKFFIGFKFTSVQRNSPGGCESALESINTPLNENRGACIRQQKGYIFSVSGVDWIHSPRCPPHLAVSGRVDHFQGGVVGIYLTI